MIIRERDEQIRVKEQMNKQQQQGIWVMIILYTVIYFAEEKMFTELWEEDRLAKSKREEMETAMQLERNREMLRVNMITNLAFLHYVILCRY